MTMTSGRGAEPVLLTVAVIAALVVVFPVASRATPVSVCEPLLAVVVFQVTE